MLAPTRPPLPATPHATAPPELLRKRKEVLAMRWLLVIATSYLLYFSASGSPRTLINAIIVAAISSNLLLSRISIHAFEVRWFYHCVVLTDTLVLAASLQLTGKVTTDFYLMFFLIILLAAIGRDLRYIVTGVAVTSLLYGWMLWSTGGAERLLHDPGQLLRIPFLIVVGMFVGHLVGEERSASSHSSRLQAEKSELEKVQRVLEASEAQFRSLTESTSAAIVIFKGERLLYANPVTAALTGYTKDELKSRSILDLVHPAYRRLLSRYVGEYRRSLLPQRGQLRILTNAGKPRWVEVSTGTIVLDDEEADIATAFDISALKAAERKLRILAYHDELTGLANRVLFLQTLNRLIHRMRRRSGYAFCVLYLDLDDFKIVNDSLGHIYGDKVLSTVAERLLACVRTEDMVARLGGDEFAIILEDINRAPDAIRVTHRIQERLREAIRVDGRDLFVATSIGIAVSDPEWSRAEDMLRAADTAMYRAKALGKSRFEVFDRAMQKRMLERLQLETDLRWAIDRAEFVLEYQPIVELESRQLAGFEALVRWRHPTRGLLAPADFIPVAEETGLIVPIGWLILRQACRQIRQWQDRLGRSQAIAVHVNLSGKQFMQPAMISELHTIVADSGIDPRGLRLEMVETMLMESEGQTQEVLERLRELGIDVLIDDFGTGYSSLSYLHRFPTSGLKIDRIFVTGIEKNWSNSELVKTIVSICHEMHKEVIAEGVETEEQAALLMGLDCRYGQGFHLGAPMDAASAGDLVERLRTQDTDERRETRM